MQASDLLHRALRFEWLTPEEGVFLFENASTAELMHAGNAMRQHHVPGNTVTWIIDRNSNTTNVCIANCKFCNFYRRPGHEESYITTIEAYKQKIEETFLLGGEQLLLQGGHHPDLGLRFYADLFRQLKDLYPNLKLHALGPPEIAHVAKLEGMSHYDVLKELKAAGLDSLPGAGAEILSDRVRRLISKGKCGGEEWLNVMRAAHQLHLTTSATMMFGHIETNLERMEHFAAIRQVQSEKPADAKGFLAFIPWPFQDEDTILKKLKRARNAVTGDEYVRMIALSRIMLPKGITKFPLSANTWIGERGSIFKIYGSGRPFVLPEEDFPLEKYPRDFKGQDHFHDWVDAILAGRKSCADFAHGGPLTESVLVGALADRFAGEWLEWDRPGLRFKNHVEATKLLRRPYRDGWKIPGLG